MSHTLCILLSALFFSYLSNPCVMANPHCRPHLQKPVDHINERRENYFEKACLFYEKEYYSQAAYLVSQLLLDKTNLERYPDLHYFHAQCLYQYEQYELSNTSFSNHLKSSPNPSHFLETLEYKYQIAQKFAQGARKPLMGVNGFPKLLGGELTALEIFDEVITILPTDELAIRSLFEKAELLATMSLYEECVYTYQTLIKRFPKHPLAITSYIQIQETFLEQSRHEMQNSDILELARLNHKHFAQDFPQEPRVEQAQKIVHMIEEVQATALYETGELFERKKSPKAAKLYYQTAMDQFPHTRIAHKASKKLDKLAS